MNGCKLCACSRLEIVKQENYVCNFGSIFLSFFLSYYILVVIFYVDLHPSVEKKIFLL